MKKIILAISALGLVFASCGKNAGFASKSTPHQFAMEEAEELMLDSEDADFSYSGGAENGAFQNANEAKRKLIYNGRISLGVENLAETKSAVERWIEKHDGYISDLSESQRSANFTVNVPHEQFFAAMEDAASFGTVKNKNIQCRDVTEQFYDLQTRLDTRRILLERLQTYLASSTNVKDLIEIETKINDVTGELEHMQGSMNRLQKQIVFSQIEVQALLPAGRDESGFIFPDVKDGARSLVGNVISFCVNFIFILIYVFIFGTLIVLALMLMYWLAFGKIGLVRKLFDKIKK